MFLCASGQNGAEAGPTMVRARPAKVDTGLASGRAQSVKTDGTPRWLVTARHWVQAKAAGPFKPTCRAMRAAVWSAYAGQDRTDLRRRGPAAQPARYLAGGAGRPIARFPAAGE